MQLEILIFVGVGLLLLCDVAAAALIVWKFLIPAQREYNRMRSERLGRRLSR